MNIFVKVTIAVLLTTKCIFAAQSDSQESTLNHLKKLTFQVAYVRSIGANKVVAGSRLENIYVLNNGDFWVEFMPNAYYLEYVQLDKKHYFYDVSEKSKHSVKLNSGKIKTKPTSETKENCTHYYRFNLKFGTAERQAEICYSKTNIKYPLELVRFLQMEHRFGIEAPSDTEIPTFFKVSVKNGATLIERKLVEESSSFSTELKTLFEKLKLLKLSPDKCGSFTCGKENLFAAKDEKPL